MMSGKASGYDVRMSKQAMMSYGNFRYDKRHELVSALALIKMLQQPETPETKAKREHL